MDTLSTSGITGGRLLPDRLENDLEQRNFVKQITYVDWIQHVDRRHTVVAGGNGRRFGPCRGRCVLDISVIDSPTISAPD